MNLETGAESIPSPAPGKENAGERFVRRRWSCLRSPFESLQPIQKIESLCPDLSVFARKLRGERFKKLRQNAKKSAGALLLPVPQAGHGVCARFFLERAHLAHKFIDLGDFPRHQGFPGFYFSFPDLDFRLHFRELLQVANFLLVEFRNPCKTPEQGFRFLTIGAGKSRQDFFIRALTLCKKIPETLEPETLRERRDLVFLDLRQRWCRGKEYRHRGTDKQ